MSGNEKYLSLRQFDDKTKALIYAKQAGYCPICHQHFEISKMEGDHIKFVLLKKVGKAVIDRTVSDDDILNALSEIHYIEDCE